MAAAVYRLTIFARAASPTSLVDINQRHCTTADSIFKRDGRSGLRTQTVLHGAALIVLLAAGCAEAQTTTRAADYCTTVARDYAYKASRQGQVLRGGALGSLVGLGIGSIGGAAGTGAAIGAGIGLIGGGIKRSSDADRIFVEAYDECIARTVR